MYKYIVKRILLMVPTLIGAAMLVFFLLRLIPGDVCELRLAGTGLYAGNNYGSYEDQALEDIYAKLLRAEKESDQRVLMREFETRALSDQVHMGITLWWYKINPHRSYVKGWKIAPSHYLNQSLDQIWLDK